jgi:hypothetical protein
MKRKTLIDKIREDETKELKKFLSKYNGLPLFPVDKMHCSNLPNFIIKGGRNVVIDNPEKKVWLYGPSGVSTSGDYVSSRTVIECFLEMEIRKLRKAGMVNPSECKRIRTLLKGDPSSIQLGMTVIDNWRNKRVRKERNASRSKRKRNAV